MRRPSSRPRASSSTSKPSAFATAIPSANVPGVPPSATPEPIAWNAVYYDSPRSLAPKLRLADDRGLAGAGFWAIGYERGLPGYTELIASFHAGKLAAPRVTAPRSSPGVVNRATLARQLLLERSGSASWTRRAALAGCRRRNRRRRTSGCGRASPVSQSGASTTAFAERARRQGHAHALDAPRSCPPPTTGRSWPASSRCSRRSGDRTASSRPTPRAAPRCPRRRTAFTAEPRSLTELREHLGHARWDRPPDEVVWWLRRHPSFVHAPAGGRLVVRPAAAARRRGRLARRPGPVRRGGAALDHLVAALPRRVRAGDASPIGALVGPAGGADPAGSSSASKRAGDLRRFADETRRGAARPRRRPAARRATRRPRRACCRCGTACSSPSTTGDGSSATRIGRVVIARNGDTLPTFLVDGLVAGRWWATADGKVHAIQLEPFGRLAARDRRALEALGDRLADVRGAARTQCLRALSALEEGDLMVSIEEHVRTAVRLAEDNVAAGQFPFAAVVVADGGAGDVLGTVSTRAAATRIRPRMARSRRCGTRADGSAPWTCRRAVVGRAVIPARSARRWPGRPASSGSTTRPLATRRLAAGSGCPSERRRRASRWRARADRTRRGRGRRESIRCVACERARSDTVRRPVHELRVAVTVPITRRP